MRYQNIRYVRVHSFGPRQLTNQRRKSCAQTTAVEGSSSHRLTGNYRSVVWRGVFKLRGEAICGGGVCVHTGHDRTPSAASRQRVTYPLGKEISRFLRAIKAFRDPFCNESGTIFPARDHRSNYNVLANEREIALTELNFFFFFILLPGLPTAHF